jgi:hypothetical protein
MKTAMRMKTNAKRAITMGAGAAPAMASGMSQLHQLRAPAAPHPEIAVQEKSLRGTSLPPCVFPPDAAGE